MKKLQKSIALMLCVVIFASTLAFQAQAADQGSSAPMDILTLQQRYPEGTVCTNTTPEFRINAHGPRYIMAAQGCWGFAVKFVAEYYGYDLKQSIPATWLEINKTVSSQYPKAAYGKTVIVVILTSHIKKENMPTHVVIESGICAGLMAQAEQIHTLEKWRLYQYIGTIDPEVMDQIEWAVCVSLGLELPKRERRCLCARCLREYQDKAKYKIRRVYRYQTSMDTCDRCRLHPGFDYWVLSNDQEIHKNRQIQQNPEAGENVNEKK